MRNSFQRQVILDVVKNSLDHPTADIIYQRVKDKVPNVSLGTVYRNLKFLSSIGELDTMETLDKSIHYDGNTTQHRHFICKKCGVIIDLFYEFEIPKQLFEAGLDVENEKVIYYGKCIKCRDN